MGTLAELKARILDEIGEGVSVRQIGQHIARAIEHYASERFWFNQNRGSTVTIAGTTTAVFPAGLRRMDLAQIGVSGSVCPLVLRTQAQLDEMTLAGPGEGQPTDCAVQRAQLQLYPVPNAVYTIIVTGIYDEAPLSTDASSNAWTTDAADLIAATAKKTLLRDIIGDGTRALAMLQAEEEAHYRLRTETTLRINTGVMRPSV